MSFTDRQKEFGFWTWDKTNDFPPESISYPDQYRGQERLNIFCTQLNGISTTDQKKLIKQWADFLPTLKNVKYIWFTSHVTQELFDGVCKVISLEGLAIKWSNIKTLDNISSLSNLKYLRIGSSAKIESIEPLTTLDRLEVLYTENFKKISDFSPIAKLTNLKFLSIEGGMYTKQPVDSFDFVSNLSDLLFFSAAATKMKHRDIKPFLKLKNLVTLNWGYDMKSDEIEMLKSTLPKLKKYPSSMNSDHDKYLAKLFGQK
jgi:hypothetical protein